MGSIKNKKCSENECLKTLRKLKEGDEKLRQYHFKDDFLLRFVRAKKCDSKAALETLKNYVHIRRDKYSSFFQSYHPKTVRHVFDSGMIRVLRHRDDLGRQVFVMKSDTWDPEEISMNDILMTALLMLEEMLNSKETQENGIVIIRDYDKFGLSHMRLCTLSEIKRACTIFVNSFPCKYKAAHIIRNSYFFHCLLAMAKPFMPQKLRDRFFVHGFENESLFKHISPDILPEFLGGKLSEEEAWDTSLEERIFKCDDNSRANLLHGIL